jgi:sensor histidine kinase YesM
MTFLQKIIRKSITLLVTISTVFSKLFKIVFNTDYRFIHRMFPGISIFVTFCCTVFPAIDLLFLKQNSYPIAFPGAIMAALIWFFPRKNGLFTFHKLYWELLLFYIGPFAGTWLSLMDPSPVNFATCLQMAALIYGFFAKPYFYLSMYPIGSLATFFIFTTITGVERAPLFSIFIYPLISAILNGMTAAFVRIALEYYSHKLLDTELQMIKIQTEKKINDLKMETLRAKSDPHFLFNALNSICQLAYESPAKTESAILSLSSLFRYILASGDRATVSLEEELAIVRSYLDLEQIRFGDRLVYRINISSDIGKVFLPALSIQPIVENSIKHGFTNKNGTGIITIDVNRKDTSALISIHDNGIGFDENKPIVNGHGLTILEERLRCLWNENASLHLKSSSDYGTIVEIIIPCRECHNGLQNTNC